MSLSRTFVVSENEWAGMLGRMMSEKPVMGPKERPDQPGSFLFDWLDQPDDFRPNYQHTTLPPKKAFFPPQESLFSFKLNNRPDLEMHWEKGPFILVGVHPCDLAAIEALDRAYGAPPAEVRWRYNRKRAAIIGLDCQPDEYCFCVSTGDSEAREPSDLFLTPIEEGFLMEVLSDTGAEMIKMESFREAATKDLAEAEDWRRRKIENTRARLNSEPSKIADILEIGDLDQVWEEIAERCYSCGSCNITCPTCYCFIMRDDLDLTFQNGNRLRTWDSCQLLEFALVAGGYNFRGERKERVRHRWHCKFLHMQREFGRVYCTGCGRCSRACTADINLVDVTNQLLAHAEKEIG